jgi:phosphoribosylanthranilate isomerase
MMSRTRVKFCGLTRYEDVQMACKLGADAIGLVFYEPSPRAVTLDQAAEILRDLPPFVALTALFVNPSASFVQAVLDRLPVSLLQFHGDEDKAFCEHFGRPYIKAIPMKDDCDVLAEMTKWDSALGLLVDTYKAGVAGGSGETFHWDRLPSPELRTKPLILAGGLDVSNIKTAIEQVKPWAVDVSGGIELSKGIKDHAKMTHFIAQVALADRTE